MKRLLGIFAHPDDETILSGGTLAKYARNGWQVDIITATKGEAGRWGSAEQGSAVTLAETRTKELEAAAEILGIRSIVFLDYQDGKLPAMPPGEIENSLVKAITELRPDIIITHDTEGGVTHHPDHIKVSKSATFAYQTYAMRRKEEDDADADPPKLYYSCFPHSTLFYLLESKKFPAESDGRVVSGADDRRITAVINIEKTKVAKMKALFAHETQRPVLEKYMDIPKNPFFKNEYFILRMVGVTEAFMGKNDRVGDRL